MCGSSQKTKTIYPTDDAVQKSVYLSIKEFSKKCGLCGRDWGIIIGQMLVFFEDSLNVSRHLTAGAMPRIPRGLTLWGFRRQTKRHTFGRPSRKNYSGARVAPLRCPVLRIEKAVYLWSGFYLEIVYGILNTPCCFKNFGFLGPKQRFLRC
jgi:hypothetical protein